jgi:hypothetical protein
MAAGSRCRSKPSTAFLRLSAASSRSISIITLGRARSQARIRYAMLSVVPRFAANSTMLSRPMLAGSVFRRAA